MKSKFQEIQIPFKNNEMLNYPSYGDIKWIDNYEFEETMKVDHYTRGCSAANFILIDSNGKKYTMFLTDFLELVKSKTIKKGTVSGVWCFHKRGKNYGVRLV